MYALRNNQCSTFHAKEKIIYSCTVNLSLNHEVARNILARC